ncbi:c-type cytochrome [Aestuariirhabdus litorea]|uniref:c-type cytochrome n=1 Tax=Aestuariirhabdus litorea TaxID=2528527 RepID=UPI0013E2E47F|nr:cytochrome c [Aestuariirhabdus litorea]
MSKPCSSHERRGQALFAQHSQSCHGTEAVGETYTIEGLSNGDYLFARTLNGTMHGWHHTDEQLTQTILS